MDYGVGDPVVRVEAEKCFKDFANIPIGRVTFVTEVYHDMPTSEPGVRTTPIRVFGVTYDLDRWHPNQLFRKFDPKTNEDDAATIAEKALSDIGARINDHVGDTLGYARGPR